MTRFSLAATVILTILVAGGGCAAFGEKSVPSYIDPGETGMSRVRYSMRSGPARAPAAEIAREALAADAEAPPQLPAGAKLDADGDASKPAPQPGESRQVVYSAAFKVVVADVPGTLRLIREQAEELGGHLQDVAGSAITVRVPAGRFNDAVAYVERLGEVVDRQMSAQDVTEELRDLRIHLDNDEKLRQRLQALLEKAEKVEDILKIEAELTRVSEEIERAKGKLRFIESQVAMSTVRVELNSPVPQNQQGTGPRLPFNWVSELGAGLVEGQVQQTVKKAGIFGRGPRFRPPAGFVRYYEDDGEVEAMDADGLRIRVLRRDNVDKADLSFWSQLARKTLVESRSLVPGEEEGAGGTDFYLLRGTRDVGGKPIGYLLGIERSDRAVVAFEAWGPRELFDSRFGALRASALSIDP